MSRVSAPSDAGMRALPMTQRQRFDHNRWPSVDSPLWLDTLIDRRGVCRDFAHLTIALCRAINIPARFVTGIDYDADPALGPCDFHAYAEVWLGDRWYLFDATGISPTTGLVRLGTGRDAADVAFATICGDVPTHAPKVTIAAVEDPAKGMRRPQRTPLAVSTATSARSRAPAQPQHDTPLPLLLHSPLDAAHSHSSR